METELLRTFLEVHRMHSFTRAAENLCLTPSAISARVRQLETELGRPLFKRSSQQVQLTPAGERMLRHALGIVEALDRAQKHVALDDRAPVTVAGVASFWDLFLQEWLNRVRTRMPQVAPWVEVSGAARVAEKLAQGEVHLGFLYSPPQIADLLLREVGRVELVLVSTRPGQGVEETLAEGYVLVDWGTVFNSQHNRHFPHRPPAAARSNSGRVALRLIRACGGGAYLPRTLVAADLARGGLHPVEEAPTFEMQAYAAYLSHGEQRELVEQMLAYV
jgi:DNA-binding transcriptional LysR family regulator